jgi:hypothetical protein
MRFMRTGMASLCPCLLVVLGLVLLAPRVSVAAMDKKSTAEAKKATLLYKQGKYEEAATMFLQLSLDNQDMPVFVRNLGACYYYLHRPEPALSNLREYLHKKKDIDPQDREEVERWIKDMEALTQRPSPSATPAPAVPTPGMAGTPPAPTPTPAYGTQQPYQQQPYQQQPYQQPYQQQPYQQQPYQQQPYQQQPYEQQPYQQQPYQQTPGQQTPYAAQQTSNWQTTTPADPNAPASHWSTPTSTPVPTTPKPKRAPYTHGFLAMPYIGLHIPVGQFGDNFGPGFRLGTLLGYHIDPLFSINGEFTVDVLNPKHVPSGVDTVSVIVDMNISPLLHLGTDSFQGFVGPKLGAFGYSAKASGGGETAEENGQGLTYGLNVGFGIPVSNFLVGGMFSFTGRHTLHFCQKLPDQDEECTDDYQGDDLKSVDFTGFVLF